MSLSPVTQEQIQDWRTWVRDYLRLYDYHGGDDAVGHAVSLLEEAKAQNLHGHHDFLDLAEHLAWEKKGSDIGARAEVLLADAATSPMFDAQLSTFLEEADVCARRFMQGVDREVAVYIMSRGPVSRKGYESIYDQMAVLRARLLERCEWLRNRDGGEILRIFSQSRNAELVELYSTWSRNELQDEVRARGLHLGSRATRWQTDALRNVLISSDSAWTSHAPLHEGPFRFFHGSCAGCWSEGLLTKASIARAFFGGSAFAMSEEQRLHSYAGQCARRRLKGKQKVWTPGETAQMV